MNEENLNPPVKPQQLLRCGCGAEADYFEHGTDKYSCKHCLLVEFILQKELENETFEEYVELMGYKEFNE
jgi:hypothetical protein